VEKLLKEIERWAGIYEFSFQFWGKDNNNVYINKDDVELASFGGEKDIHTILVRVVQYLRKINPNGLPVKKIHRCKKCNRITVNEYCSDHE